MIERILSRNFRKTLRAIFRDISTYQKREENERLKLDEARIMRDLSESIIPHPTNQPLEEDYLVAAIDGSGSPDFVVINDIRIHLFTSATVVFHTGTRDGRLFHEINPVELSEALGTGQPRIDFHWHTGVKEDTLTKVAETIAHFYPVKFEDLILPFFRDWLGQDDLNSFENLGETEYGPYVNELSDLRSLLSRAPALTNAAIHDELRKVFEYDAARRLIESKFKPRYLLLDGSLSIFTHLMRKYPTMPSGFILRHLLELARKKGVIVCAISKNHTVPAAHQIARAVRKKSGGSKWFCFLPSKREPGGELHIYENRTYIPPILAVSYLFSFSDENRPSRVDFDRVWWEKHVLDTDSETMKEKAKLVFRDLEFMSRDARWYGYPVPLGVAHERCVLRRDDLRMAREIARGLIRNVGLDSGKLDPLREDYNM
ncbi:MAG: hypothetical protein ACTSVD_02690 [Candidatus Thorarchaeota archaeon]|nr:MAG: hypothetical protein DRO73_00070 [Candidatus Thorarchaeota archaeon]RLI61548.1 MAG: hypothetical protein DRO93_03985 [Candidatus Thorarchaeota archaeon]